MSTYKPYKYQEHAGQHIRENLKCGLFLDMGLGKTVITLTEIDYLMNADLSINKTLVIGPKRVIQSVWKQEAQKWAHLKHLKMSMIWGTPRERSDALMADADIYLVNCENVVWLMQQLQSRWKFDMVIVDELSKFKSSKSQRFKALKVMTPFIKRLVGLTGTPAPNGLMDLWAQLYLMDDGARLEKTITGYRERYFVAESEPGALYKTYRLRKEAKDAIYSKIGDICISMKADDYLDLPELITNDIIIDLSPGNRLQYDDFAQEQIMLLGTEEITALSGAALGNKLMQFGNGAVYHSENPKDYTVVHDEKLDALDDILDESQGQPVMVFYTFRHDAERLINKYPHARRLKTDQDILDWNNGKIKLLLAHPASAGHGLNLQAGGHILIWFGLNWSLELYLQAIARLLRLGQTHTVIMHRLLIRNSMDTRVAKVLALKEGVQNDLLDATRAYIYEIMSGAS